MNWFMRSEARLGELAAGQAGTDGTFPRRLPSAIVALVILGAAVGSGVAVSNNGPASSQAGGAGNASPGASSTASASDLSQERSPGMRGDAVLNKTKQARADKAASSPQKRRSRLIPQKAIAGLPAAATPLILPFDMAALTLPTDQLQRGMAAVGSSDLMPVALVGSNGAAPGGPAVVALPAVSGSGSGGDVGTPGGAVGPVITPAPLATATPAPVPQVPEPSVWLTMLIGFGLIGAMLRGKRSRRVDVTVGKSAGA